MSSEVKDVELKASYLTELFLTKHADFIHAYSLKTDDYEYIMTEYLRMSGIYWGLTAMDLMSQLHRMDRAVSATGSHPGRRPGMLYSIILG